jgi:hypothetical protein
MIVQGQTTIFKQNLLSKLEDFSATTSYVYKIALYDANANLDNSTLTYTTTDEVTGTGYTAGGQVLAPSIGTDFSNNTAYVTFTNVIWSPANFTASGALIYNSTTNAAVAVLNFGNTKTATNTFTVTFPAGTSTSAVIRLGQSN